MAAFQQKIGSNAMIICIKFGGHQHCFIIPYLEIPIKFPKVGPGPVNYPQLFADAVLLGSIRQMTQHIADTHVRQALEHGFSTAQEAMQKHAGSEVTIRAE
jgi:hypothetical protein